MKKRTIRINKDLVKKHIKFRYGTITKFLEDFGISKVRLWQILNGTYTKITHDITKLAKFLGLTEEEIIGE